jgi:hypothetical protein
MPDGSPLPADNPGNLHYHLEDFENVLRLLAGDKTVYLLYSGTGAGFENGIITAAEPVGDAVSLV